jgi:hypothetical protein
MISKDEEFEETVEKLVKYIEISALFAILFLNALTSLNDTGLVFLLGSLLIIRLKDYGERIDIIMLIAILFLVIPTTSTINIWPELLWVSLIKQLDNIISTLSWWGNWCFIIIYLIGLYIIHKRFRNQLHIYRTISILSSIVWVWFNHWVKFDIYNSIVLIFLICISISILSTEYLTPAGRNIIWNRFNKYKKYLTEPIKVALYTIIVFNITNLTYHTGI